MTYISDKLRQLIVKRADGRCEYCRLSERFAYHTHEIDHIYAEKHGGSTEETNLCLACVICNRYKGSDLCSLDPITNQVVSLFHPRIEKWKEHFTLVGTGIIQPLTATGRVTERILRFNRLDLVADRARLISIGGYKSDFV